MAALCLCDVTLSSAEMSCFYITEGSKAYKQEIQTLDDASLRRELIN